MPLQKAKMAKNQVELNAKGDLIALPSFGLRSVRVPSATKFLSGYLLDIIGNKKLPANYANQHEYLGNFVQITSNLTSK
jgi:hypothetical protein